MALKTDAENLHAEIQAAEEFRDNFLENLDTLIDRYTGRYFRADRRPERAMVENHAYEFLSVMLPQLVYDSPRVRLRAADPSIQADSPVAVDAFGGVTTMGDMAEGIELALNRWAVDSEIVEPLTDLAVNFFFAYAPALVTIDDQPGRDSAEFVPQRPLLMPIDPAQFIIDPTAKTHNPMQHDGPRYMAHMWKADLDGLIREAEDDPSWNADALHRLVSDMELEKYDPQREDMSGTDIPERNEVLAWEVWVPEDQLTDEPGYNGSWHTVAIGQGNEGDKQTAQTIRKPVPAHCPPWGPYVLFGAYKVPRTPYPMSPLMATAEQAEETNAHAAAAAADAKNYKHISYSDKKNQSDADTIISARHGDHVLLDDAENVGDIETGGVSDTQYKYIDQARNRLERISGLSGSMRGDPDEDTTATAESIAKMGTDLRVAGLKRQYRAGVTQVFRTAAYYMFHGEDQVHKLGEDGLKAGMAEFQGGLFPGREHFDYFDLSLSLDPLSMEHMDQQQLQARVMEAMKIVGEYAQLMPQTPWIRWREPLRAMFEALNVGDADEWVDYAQLAQNQQMNQQEMVQRLVSLQQEAQGPPDMRVGESGEGQQSEPGKNFQPGADFGATSEARSGASKMGQEVASS